MKYLTFLSLCTITATMGLMCHAQTPPGTAAGSQLPVPPKTGIATPPAGQKPKPFSTAETHAILSIADSLQFQMNMAQRIQSRFRETDKDLTALGARLRTETIGLWTPMVDLASARGVDGKKIPMAMSKTDTAALAKFNAIKDDKKWKVAFFELFSKETRKNIRSAEATAKTVTDPDLKAWIEKAVAGLQPQAEQLETTHKELKSGKNK